MAATGRVVYEETVADELIADLSSSGRKHTSRHGEL